MVSFFSVIHEFKIMYFLLFYARYSSIYSEYIFKEEEEYFSTN